MKGVTVLSRTSVRQKANISSTTTFPYSPDNTTHRYVLTETREERGKEGIKLVQTSLGSLLSSYSLNLLKL